MATPALAVSSLKHRSFRPRVAQPRRRRQTAGQSDEELTFPEPSEGLVKPQVDSVVAFLDEPDQVVAAMDGLVEQGFERDQIWVLCGAKGPSDSMSAAVITGYGVASTAWSSG